MTHALFLLFPLLNFVLLSLAQRHIQVRLASFVSCVLMAGSALSSLSIAHDVLMKGSLIVKNFFPWIQLGVFTVSWGIYIDTLSALMISVVTLISFLVHLYSVGYMSHDRTPIKFQAYLSLFTFMMLMLVTGDSLLQVFFGWEGVGLASYLLIGYWYHKPSASDAAVKAFIVNRVGDLGLVLALAGFFWAFHDLSISAILSKIGVFQDKIFHLGLMHFPMIEVLGLLLFFGAMGKSAQLGLHIWLPDAMEGPTPVSALIHAATMVTAGVFLVARFSPLYEMAPIAKQTILIVGTLTALFAASVALTQWDIKKVVAYSTCSQLGYMFMALGLGSYHLAIFHLVTHAFFKALLFLGAGSVIHAMSDEQNMAAMGGIAKRIPLTYSMMWIGSLALAGVPLFAGYYSKDGILNAALAGSTPWHLGAYGIGLFVAFLTALYSWRLIYLTFHGKARADERIMGHLHEPETSMLLPLVVLAIGSIFSGWILAPYVNLSAFWRDAVAFSSPVTSLLSLDLLHNLHHLPTLCAFLGIGVSTAFYLLRPTWPNQMAQRFQKIYVFLKNKWYFDELYTFLLVKPYAKLGAFLWQKGDGSFLDRRIIASCVTWAVRFSQRLGITQSGIISHYATWMVLGLGVALVLLFSSTTHFIS